MSDVGTVLKRIETGDRVRFFEDYYGRQWIEIRRPWLLWPKTRLNLRNDQVVEIKTALRRRARARAAAKLGQSTMLVKQ